MARIEIRAKLVPCTIEEATAPRYTKLYWDLLKEFYDSGNVACKVTEHNHKSLGTLRQSINRAILNFGYDGKIECFNRNSNVYLVRVDVE